MRRQRFASAVLSLWSHWVIIDVCTTNSKKFKETNVVPAFLKKESEEAGTAPVSSKKNIKENRGDILTTINAIGKEKVSRSLSC